MKKYFLFILFVIIFVFLIIKNNNIKKVKNEILFYKCNKYVLGKIIKEVLYNNNIKRTHNIEDKWLLFLPCTYNDIEKEMKKMDDTTNKILFGIKGCDLIVSKNNLWKLLENKYGRNNSKKLMPETWILSNKDQIELFKQEIFYLRAESSIQYIRIVI